MPKRILVIDDDETIGNNLREMLNILGYEASYCNTGTSALLKMKEDCDTPHLIITDLEMPGMIDGLELTRGVKGFFPEIPVIIITGQPDLIPEVNPANMVIGKPFDLNTLLENIAILI